MQKDLLRVYCSVRSAAFRVKEHIPGAKGGMKGLRRRLGDRRGFGMNELLGIAAALILAAFIVIPGLRTFADTIMDGLSAWWNSSIAGVMFPKS